MKKERSVVNPIALRNSQNSMEFWPFLSAIGLIDMIDGTLAYECGKS